jgi:hypothetical protein
VFLHGLWRSGSTYVWSRFRVAEGTCCYYEPLHDGLVRLTRARIGRDTPESVEHNRHPAMEQPYFAEFRPLVGRRGVKGYQRRFAYTRFAPASTDQDPALEAYVHRLIDQAHGEARSPVLGFNRTGLRVGWLAERFDAFNIHIDRDPIDVFSSYASKLHDGNHYYFVKWMQIIAGNPDYPLFRAALPLFRQPNVIEQLLKSPKKYYRKVIEESSRATLYSITFLAWAACALHALEHSDLIMDISLAERPGYLGELAEAIRHGSGLSVTFDDMHAPAPPSPLHPSQQRAIEQDVLSWIASAAEDGLFDRARIRARLGELSPRRAGLLATVI